MVHDERGIIPPPGVHPCGCRRGTGPKARAHAPRGAYAAVATLGEPGMRPEAALASGTRRRHRPRWPQGARGLVCIQRPRANAFTVRASDAATCGPPKKRSTFSVTKPTRRCRLWPLRRPPGPDHGASSRGRPRHRCLPCGPRRQALSEERVSTADNPAGAGCGRGGRGASGVHPRRGGAFASTSINDRAVSHTALDLPKRVGPSRNDAVVLSVSEE
jgi:hypothetical protein